MDFEDMLGHGEPKMLKEDPCPAGGGEREEGDGGGGAGDNLSGDVQHPLLYDPVMEMLFKKFSLLNHKRSSYLPHLAKLRLVCKAWNREIGKIIRNETRVNVNKIIFAYPQGLGWTATSITTGDDQDGMPFKYSAPMPEAIGTFQNLTVTIQSCEDFTNTSILKWFQVMGSSVKSLHLTGSLSCYHQNRFVEKILKEWCPNLKSFTLQGVGCFEILVQNSFFAEPSVENECRSLKEFILSLDGILRKDTWSEICGLRIEDLEILGRDQQIPDVTVRMKTFNMRSLFVQALAKYLDQAREAATSVAPEEEDLLNQMVRRPIGLTSIDGMSPRSFGSHVADFFQGKFSCDPDYENDGGIVGQLMKMSRLEKLFLRKSIVGHEFIFNELFSMFFYLPNLWRSSLQHFECSGHCPVVTSGYISTTFRPPPKNIFPRVGFPLKTLKFVQSSLDWNDRFEPGNMEGILRGCAETLEELEFGVGCLNCRHRRRLILPVLSKLKVFVVKTDDYQVVKVTSQDILRKLPKLERCDVTIRWDEWEATEFFEDALSDELLENGGRGSHPLKELKLLEEYVVQRDIERLVMCFPNLKIVNLSIVEECGKVFKAFWEKMGELPLEQVKIYFLDELREDMADDVVYENAIGDNIEGFKDLQWLELELGAKHPFPLTKELSKGFTKSPKLRVLKLINFEVDEDDAEDVKKDLVDVVVQLRPK